MNRFLTLLTFFVTKNVDAKRTKLENCLDLPTHHSAIIMIIFSKVVIKENQPSLHNKTADREQFRTNLDILISFELPLKTIWHRKYSREIN